MSRRSRETTGPNVVIPTMTESNPRAAVERIAAFAQPPDRSSAIAALPGRPFQALREQFEEYRAPGRRTLIGGARLRRIRQHSSTPVLCATWICATATWRVAASVIRATTSGPFSPPPSKREHPGRNSCSRSLQHMKSNAGFQPQAR